MKIVEFSKTTFYKGLNATYGKLPVKLEVYLDFQEEDGYFKRGHSSDREEIPRDERCPIVLKLGLFVGMDKLYRVSDIGHFLEALEGLQPYHFNKNFIFEPAKMYFEKADKRLLEFLRNLKITQELHTNEVVLNKAQSESLLDNMWDHIGAMGFCKQSEKIVLKMI
jgi:hypothetical protein